VAADSIAEDITQFPLEGPRITGDVVTQLAVMGKTPMEHDESWRHLMGLAEDDPESLAHRGPLEAVQDGALFDQLDVKNCVIVEHCLRQACLVEYQAERRLEARLVTQGKGAASSVERGLILGNRHRRSNTIIPPSFRSWLSGEMQDEANRQKAERKLREEVAARGTTNKGKGDAKGALLLAKSPTLQRFILTYISLS
jgi:hypothetical protein